MIDLQQTWFDADRYVWWHMGRFWTQYRAAEVEYEDVDGDDSLAEERTTYYFRPVRWNDNQERLEYDMEGGVIRYVVVMTGDRPDENEDEEYEEMNYDTFESADAYFMAEGDDDPMGDDLPYQETTAEVDTVLRPMMAAAHV